MEIERTDIIIIALVGLLLFVFFKKPAETLLVDPPSQEKIDSLLQVNALLMDSIRVKNIEILYDKRRADSLEDLEPIIIRKYVDRYKNIEYLSAHELSAQFDSVFAAGPGK